MCFRKQTCLPTAFGCLSEAGPKIGSLDGGPFHRSLDGRLIVLIDSVASREIEAVVNKHAVGVEDCMRFQALIRRYLGTSKRQSNDAHGAHRLRKNGHDDK